MSEIYSTASSGKIKQADSNNIMAPDLNMQTDNASEHTHGYFVPVVMMIVLGIIVVATFYSTEFNSLIAGVASPDRDNDRTKAEQRLIARMATEGESEDAAESSAITETAVANSASSEDVTKISGTAAPDSTLTTPDTSLFEPASADASSAEFRTAAAQDKPVSYTGKQLRGASPYAPPMPYDMPENYRQYYNEIMELRRRTHAQAMQARRAHMKKMHEYRTVVRKRIKQDRLDRYLRVHEIAQES